METYNLKLGKTETEIEDVLNLTKIANELVYGYIKHYKDINNFLLAYNTNDDASVQIITYVKRIDYSYYNVCEVYNNGVGVEQDQFDYILEAKLYHAAMNKKYLI